MSNIENMVKQYQNGSFPKSELLEKLFQVVSPLFQISHMMSGLDMSWTIDGSGIIADVRVGCSSLQEKMTVKLRLDDKDMAQIPYGYLINGRLPESEELQIFFRMLGEKGVFIDIGANIGWYSILAARYGSGVYSFEPIEKTYRRLCANIELNELTGIKTYNLGLGESAGEDKFYFYDMASGAASRADLNNWSGAISEVQEMTCMIDTLDHICSKEKLERIDLIKCDVEGGELFVFKGGIETLRRFRPFVLCEMLRKWSAKFNYHPNEIIHLFEELNYKCIALDRKHIGAGYILKQMQETTAETNFLFYPVEKEEMVLPFIRTYN